jgi:hypothetical protein
MDGPAGENQLTALAERRDPLPVSGPVIACSGIQYSSFNEHLNGGNHDRRGCL